jgi:hypothetical protein
VSTSRLIAVRLAGPARAGDLLAGRFLDGALLAGVLISASRRVAPARTLSTLAARLARFFGSKLMRSAFLMGRAAAFAGDFPLLFGVHPRKATFGGMPVRHQRFS